MLPAEIGPEAHSTNVSGSWHALYTRHQHEKVVAHILVNQGHEIFLPLIRSIHRWQDREKQLSLPLFPGYLFIRNGFDRPLRVLSTPGVINLVGGAGRPACIPREQIEAVRKMIESSLAVEQYPLLKCGDRVVVEAGPLKGIRGILARKKNSFRLVVAVEMLGRAAAVEVDISCVKRVGFVPLGIRSISAAIPA